MKINKILFYESTSENSLTQQTPKKFMRIELPISFIEFLSCLVPSVAVFDFRRMTINF